ncbi:uncharacterized protein RJT21DRAFT_120336 [Scheffersomyces amazonensis]|uniref:uncharacterized protein n=1 Tax=Scheffersomyces amazonensis TaxID=1078765 RepID=UPI00315DF600
MASVEQDDLFNVEDNEDEMEEEEEEGDDGGNENYGDVEGEEDEEIEEDGDGDGDEDEDEEGEDDDDEDDDDEDEDGEEEEEEEEEDEDMEGEEEEGEAEAEAEGGTAEVNKNGHESSNKGGDDNDNEEKFEDAKETQDEELKPPSSELQEGEADEEDKDKEEDNTDNNQSESLEQQDGTVKEINFRDDVIAKAKIASEFDIIPSVAIPYTSQCHSLAFTDGPKWILTGGEDGFIRKYDFIASIQGKSPLTMAQKHNLVADSLTKAGVICSYWENEQPMTRKQLMEANPKLKVSDFSTGSVSYEPKVNPVYALDVERSGYWCLSGLLSGGISLYTMRYNEGAIHHYFPHSNKKSDGLKGHNDAVSVIKLNTSQDKFLSGSWDKTVREWDLHTGKTNRIFSGSSGQISNIQYRPQGLTDLSIDIVEEEEVIPEPIKSEKSINGDGGDEEDKDIDSLFGESDAEGDTEISNNKRKEEESSDKAPSQPEFNNSKISNKTYKNEDIFMSSSIDGTINIWDVRVANPVLRLGVSEGIPPWCMSSTWSNCGEFIYAGRRNSVVEEFSIKMPHKRSPKSGQNKDTMIPNVSKLLQFPKISGPVSSISTMPNNNFILCGSNDNIRLYDLTLYDEHANVAVNAKKQATPFLIIPGHQGGMLSTLYVDETGRFMVSASGNRGWGHSSFTDTVLIYEIDLSG